MSRPLPCSKAAPSPKLLLADVVDHHRIELCPVGYEPTARPSRQ